MRLPPLVLQSPWVKAHLPGEESCRREARYRDCGSDAGSDARGGEAWMMIGGSDISFVMLNALCIRPTSDRNLEIPGVSETDTLVHHDLQKAPT